MILRRLEMRNFRCYRKSTSIDFAYGKKNLTLLHGINGAGKTSLFLALNWVLYGKLQSYDGQLLNNNSLKAATELNPATGSVRLEFEHEGFIYNVSRHLIGFKLGNGSIREQQSDLKMLVTRPDGNNDEESANLIETRINRILPEAIRTFFFFDADKMADFTKPGKDRDRAITKAVNEVLKIDALVRGYTHIEELAKTLRKKNYSENDPAINALRGHIQQIEDEVVKVQSEIQADLDESDRNENRIIEIDNELASIAEVAAKAEKRIALDDRLKQLRKELPILRARLAKGCVDALPIVLGPRINGALALLNAKRQKKEIPAKIRDVFLKELIDEASCICGRDLLPGSPEVQKLDAILKSLLPGSLQDKANDLLFELQSVKRNSTERSQEVLDYLRAIQGNLQTQDLTSDAITELGDEIYGDLLAKHKSLERERTELRRSKSYLDGKVGVSGVRLRDLQNRLKMHNKNLESAYAKKEEYKLIAEQLRVMVRCSETLDTVRRKLEKQIANDLGDEATRILLQITKEGYFERVEVESDFILKLYDRSGNEVRAGISAGQTQAASLAFVLAMTQLGGQNAPLVIDTPYARLSEHARQNMSRLVQSLSNQLVLLVTDTEFDAVVKEQLLRHIGKEYVLEFVDGETLLRTGTLG